MKTSRWFGSRAVILFVCFGVGLAALAALRKASSTSASQVAPQVQSAGAPHGGTTAGQSETLLPDGRMLLLGGAGLDGLQRGMSLKDMRTGQAELLAGRLGRARAWHTATLLPDGTVLILGGVGRDGHLISQAEVFDPGSGSSRDLPSSGLTPRSHHTATLLTNGQVLVAGGFDAQGEPLATMELWNFQTNQVTTVSAGMLVARSRHSAILQADGTVLLWGGVDGRRLELNYGEIFDPGSMTVRMQGSLIRPVSDLRPPELAQSIPADNAGDVPLNAFVGLRFSKPLAVPTVNTTTAVLSASGENVAAKVVPAEDGLLAFVMPAAPLRSGEVYTLLLSGMLDSTGQALPDTEITFSTKGDSDISKPGHPVSGEGTIPDPLNSFWRKMPPLHAAPGVTALAGQALTLDGRPLAEVSLEIDSVITHTDHTGRFLLQPLAAGHHVLWIDGGTAGTRQKKYGVFEVGVDIVAGQTNVLNYTIWMTALDTAHAVNIPSPTMSEVVIKTPLLPGLELHLPPQTTIKDRKGQVVRTVSITAIPLNQPPFPLPRGVLVPTYFTIQPGGAYLEVKNPAGPKGAQLYYPNAFHFTPGTPFNFYNYNADLATRNWYVYGQGKVSPDAAQVIPDPGTVIYEFTGAMVSQPTNKPQKGKKPTNPDDGEPVDLQTGLFDYSKTDLTVTDVIPIVLSRAYRQMDSVPRAFGIGTNHPYDMFLVGDNNGDFGVAPPSPEGYTYQDLVLANGSSVHFTRTSPCLGPDGLCQFNNAEYAATSAPGQFYGATIKYTGTRTDTWLLTLKDGTVYTFPDSDAATVPQFAAVIAMQDRYGNTVTFTRDPLTHNLTQIVSPNGRWIQFTYDSSNRIVQAEDNIGRTVGYTYDAGGRLFTVTDPKGGITTYTYDSNNNMRTIKDPRGIVYLTNEYDANNRVHRQIQADGGIFQFDYTLDANGQVTQTNVTDPMGNIRQVLFNSDGFMTSDTNALGKPEQQTVTYNRQTGSNLVVSQIDPLNRQTAFAYDAMGNVTSVTQLAGTPDAVTAFSAYEPKFNKVTSTTDPLGHTTSYSYDSKGNLVTVTDALGNSTVTTYNSAGQPVTVTDPLGNMSHFIYEGGDLVAVTDALGNSVSRFVDPAGRLAISTDPLGRVTKYSYDALNQVAVVTDPVGNQTSFSYDENGNRLTVTDANHNPTAYTYDNMDRVATRTDALQRQESYQYNKNGSLTQFTDRRGKVTTYSYDALNRLTFKGFGTQPGPTYESTINYTYDAGNRMTQVVDSAGGTITEGYDVFDRLTSEITAQGSISYGYDNGGRRTSTTVAGQPQISYTYDDANRLTQITQNSASVSFAYDAASRRTSVILPNTVNISYSYDNGSRLARISYQFGADALGNLGYAYDQLGHRTQVSGTFARTGLPNPISSAAYDAANELTNWNGTSIAYDSSGNMLSDGSNVFTWNARNEVATLNGVSLQYDGMGRRLKNAAGKFFLYDGVNSAQELSGTTPTANTWAGGVDEIFQRTDSNGTVVPVTDALGSVLALADTNGNLVTQYSYDPFGNTTVSGAASTNPSQYTGRENEGNGLYFLRARYYSPQLGRFISQDPIGFAGSGTNLYAYVFDSPIDAIDPFGLAPGDWWDPRSYKTLPQELNPFNPQGTFSKEALAIGDSFTGMVTGDWAKVAAAADNTPLGMTEMYGRSCDKFNKYVGYYGVRAALTGAAIADLAAASLMALDALGISNLGDWEVGWKGGEITLKDPTSPFKGPDFRLNPFGDWDNPNPNARPPHWHQRPGIGKHLPWDWWF